MMCAKLIAKIKSWFFSYDPLDIKKEINQMNARTAQFQGDIYHSMRRFEELTKAFIEFEEKAERHMFLTQVNKALDHAVPDMFWVKDKEGKYIIANKAIRDKLLFDDNPVGKDDRQLATAIIDSVGEENHTFGAICGNSDLEVLKHELPMKFNEDGLVNGEYMMLQVHKNVVRCTKGEIAGVVGVGRDITYEVGMINKAIETTSCDATRKILQEMMDHYKFEDRT